MRGVMPEIVAGIRIGVMRAAAEIVGAARVGALLSNRIAVGVCLRMSVASAFGQKTIAEPIFELHHLFLVARSRPPTRHPAHTFHESTLCRDELVKERLPARNPLLGSHL